MAGRYAAERHYLGLSGLLDGLDTLLAKLGELAEKGEELRRSGQTHDAEGKLGGVYGFNIKLGNRGHDLEILPFGNLHKDKATGRTVVSEVREPMVDVFDKDD